MKKKLILFLLIIINVYVTKGAEIPDLNPWSTIIKNCYQEFNLGNSPGNTLLAGESFSLTTSTGDFPFQYMVAELKDPVTGNWHFFTGRQSTTIMGGQLNGYSAGSTVRIRIFVQDNFNQAIVSYTAATLNFVDPIIEITDNNILLLEMGAYLLMNSKRLN